MHPLFKVSIHFLGANIRRHGDNGDGWEVLANIQSGRDTVQHGHHNVHEDHIEVVAILQIRHTLERNGTVGLRDMLAFGTFQQVRGASGPICTHQLCVIWKGDLRHALPHSPSI